MTVFVLFQIRSPARAGSGRESRASGRHSTAHMLGTSPQLDLDQRWTQVILSFHSFLEFLPAHDALSNRLYPFKWNLPKPSWVSSPVLFIYFSLKFFLIFIHFFFERQSVSGGGAEREGDPESKAGSRLRAASTEPNVGLQRPNHEIMTWAEVRCFTNTEPLRHPSSVLLKCSI